MTIAPPNVRCIAIASGKGGVGKTWLSITLAHAMARSGRRVLMFDADLGLANADVQLGVLPEHDLGSLLDGRRTLQQVVTPVEGTGFDLLAGKSGSGKLAGMELRDLEIVLSALRGAVTSYDAVIMDLGAGLERMVRRLAAFADTLVVVATEEPTSLTDAYAFLKVHKSDRRAIDARIVVNLARSQSDGERTFATLHRACGTFLSIEPKLAGVIRRDDRVRDSIRRQVPLLTRYPGCAAALDVEAAARALL